MKPILDAPSQRSPSSAFSLERAIVRLPVSNAVPASRQTLTRSRWWLWVGAACVVTLLVFVVCLGFGTQTISYSTIIAVIMGATTGPSMELGSSDPTSVILLQVRMPRVVLAFFVGGSLAMVGVALQALLRNPLADPFVIGISSGAALGAAIALLFGLGISVGSLSALPVCAFAGALLSLIIMYRISSAQYGFSVYTLLLAGVVLNAIFSAFIMFLTSIADPNQAFGMYAWLMGTLTGPDWPTLGILVLYLGAGLVILGIHAQSLNLLTLGEETARSLGVEVERVKKMVFLSAALLTGAVVSFSGIIGFVGLIIPHAVRLVVSADHRLLLPVAGLVGGMFLMLADTVARTALSPSEFPVGVITALVGGPIFLWLLTTRQTQLGMK
ncbi:MAG: iron ABC transporter permease [Nitrospirota bacterium]|nr:iron ABC transporter permease [Nitrospirota bacterium]MDH5586733.1 iron ABC transporter permease [Nitrospirota bacterium]